MTFIWQCYLLFLNLIFWYIIRLSNWEKKSLLTSKRKRKKKEFDIRHYAKFAECSPLGTNGAIRFFATSREDQWRNLNWMNCYTVKEMTVRAVAGQIKHWNKTQNYYATESLKYCGFIPSSIIFRIGHFGWFTSLENCRAQCRPSMGLIEAISFHVKQESLLPFLSYYWRNSNDEKFPK